MNSGCTIIWIPECMYRNYIRYRWEGSFSLSCGFCCNDDVLRISISQCLPILEGGSIAVFSLMNGVTITDWGLVGAVSQLPKIRIINLTSCITLTDSAIVAMLKLLPDLEGITMSETRITDYTIHTIIQNPGKIVYLDISKCKRVTLTAITSLIVNMIQLRTLIIKSSLVE